MRIVPPLTQNLEQWAENIRRYLGKALNQLDAKDHDDNKMSKRLFQRKFRNDKRERRAANL